ncbi:MAG: hypothetical protein J5585_02780 [Clostridia bacterium]|nr:hypothetical protein [Clostridia bacterium]
MEKQPAKMNYFFRGGYVELWCTIRSSFEKLGENISDAWDDVSIYFSDFWDSFWPSIGDIIHLEADWDELFEAAGSICKFSFSLGKLILVLAITPALTIAFSLLHIMILFPIMLLAYTAFLLLLAADGIYCGIKKISSNCSNPNCQDHFLLPHYKCPFCGAIHTRLRPSRYGIWKRTCECGQKLPTTFFNGRQKLDAFCPNPRCGFPIKDGGMHRDICIPVVGGPSSGKTCFINAAITQIERSAKKYGLLYEYSPSSSDDYKINSKNMSRGRLPDKTNEMRLKYYQFYLRNSEKDLKHLISLCDIGGEVYSDSAALGDQIGYRYANAFVMVIDPLSIVKFRNSVRKKSLRPEAYNYSVLSIDEILSRLIVTLENMYCISSKDMLRTDVAVVFTKCDIPGIENIIGENAVNAYIAANPGCSRYAAQNAVCEKFLRDYNEVNFMNSLKSKFKTLQFFVCSALGHNADGSPFYSFGVDKPVLWLIDRISVPINLKGKLGE